VGIFKGARAGPAESLSPSPHSLVSLESPGPPLKNRRSSRAGVLFGIWIQREPPAPSHAIASLGHASRACWVHVVRPCVNASAHTLNWLSTTSSNPLPTVGSSPPRKRLVVAAGHGHGGEHELVALGRHGAAFAAALEGVPAPGRGCERYARTTSAWPAGTWVGVRVRCTQAKALKGTVRYSGVLAGA
jgi:hypothetical protein